MNADILFDLQYDQIEPPRVKFIISSLNNMQLLR